MNQVIKQLQNRRSVRSFTGEKVTPEHLTEILRAGQQSPTSINGQQISLVVVEDKATIAKIAEIAGGQQQVVDADKFILIVADFNRTSAAVDSKEKKQIIHESAEGIIVGAVDAGIMLNALQTAAESFGYGTTAIGGIRRNPDAMIKLLNLPKYTYPLVGTIIGVPDQSKPARLKPRVPFNSFVHFEKYDTDAVKNGIAEYDRQLRKWWDEQNLTNFPDYSGNLSAIYSQIYFPTIAQTMNAQGFVFKDEV